MESLPEHLPTSEPTNTDSLSKPVKSLASGRKGKKKYDWTALKADWFKSDFMELSSFFADKQIAHNSYAPNVKGWIDEKEELKRQAFEKVAKKQAISKFTSQARMGRLLRLRCGRLLTADKLSKASVAEINAVLRTSSELEGAVNQSGAGTAAQIVVTQGKGADEVRTEIKLIAGNLARSTFDRATGRPVILGDTQHPDGGEQPVQS